MNNAITLHKKYNWSPMYELIKNERPDYMVFTITVCFRGLRPVMLYNGFEDAAQYFYRKIALTKIRKRLCRAKKHWNTVLPDILPAVYEYEHVNHSKLGKKRNFIHHVHGSIMVPCSLASRIYRFDSCEIDNRLTRDILSSGKSSASTSVSSFYIEPLKMDSYNDWHGYLLKQKHPGQIDSFLHT